jgi:hypothetical protein
LITARKRGFQNGNRKSPGHEAEKKRTTKENENMPGPLRVRGSRKGGVPEGPEKDEQKEIDAF